MTPSTLVREARLSAGLTQAQLADRLGTTQPVIARLERADANPTFETVERALEAAGFSIELHARPLPAEEVDESQIVAMLRLTPAERLATFERSHRNLNAMLRVARRVPRDDT